jgi:hypothetical protein
MTTKIEIHGTQFYMNGRPTYAGRAHAGRKIEGLLFNSRMVQAIFDDENPATAAHWRYPDTGFWDADRNTDEFCAMLPVYAQHGVLGVTVGLQGGGAVYAPHIYDHYKNSAFTAAGKLKPAYCERLTRVLHAADQAGVVVIVNYFYWRQLQWLEGEQAIMHAAETATDWLLDTGYENILVDVMNEIQEGSGLLQSMRIHEVLTLVKSRQRDGRRLLVSTSIHPQCWLPGGSWSEHVDFYLPHGNDQDANQLRHEIQALRSTDHYLAWPRPILINEDSIHLQNLEAAADEYVSWGYYSQGYGCSGYHGRFNWNQRERETDFEDLSGFQTVPVHWGLNTTEKRNFFHRVRAITGTGT